MPSVMLPTASGNLKEPAGRAAVTAAAAAAAAGMSAEEAAAGGSSSASYIRGQNNMITREEQRHLSHADYHTRTMATGGSEGMVAGEGNMVVTGGGVAMGSAGAMNEEFLRDYFTDVSI